MRAREVRGDFSFGEQIWDLRVPLEVQRFPLSQGGAVAYGRHRRDIQFCMSVGAARSSERRDIESINRREALDQADHQRPVDDPGVASGKENVPCYPPTP